MESWHWVVLVLGIFLVIGLIQNLMNPPKEIPWTEVPEEFRAVFEASLPGFVVDSVKHLPAAYEYKVKGSYRERQGVGEIECGPKGALREIEYEDSRAGAGVTGSESCKLSDFSPEAMAHLGELLGSERESFRQTRVTKGRYANEPAYKLKGVTKSWRWDLELAGDGTLLELEKTKV